MATNINEILRADFNTDLAVLKSKYSELVANRVVRLRGLYNWMLANPSSSDRDFVDYDINTFSIEKSMAYADLSVIKTVLPEFHKQGRDFARWKYNEMIMETYKMAKARKDTKTMERAATSYAKYNRIDTEDENALPFDLIVNQPFTATDDPSVLGIKRIKNIDQKIHDMIDKYVKESIDIEDIEYETEDLEEDDLFDSAELIEDGE